MLEWLVFYLLITHVVINNLFVIDSNLFVWLMFDESNVLYVGWMFLIFTCFIIFVYIQYICLPSGVSFSLIFPRRSA